MKCQEFKENISFKDDLSQLTREETEHLNSCSDCAEFLEEMHLIFATLGSPSETEIGMTVDEKVRFHNGLDEKITEYRGRAFGFYNWSVKYGTSIAALFLVAVISIFSTLTTTDTSSLDNVQFTDVNYFDDGTSLYGNSYVLTTDDVDYGLEDEYIDIAIDNYGDNFGFGSSEELVGELSPEEYEYLMENINVGDIL